VDVKAGKICEINIEFAFFFFFFFFLAFGTNFHPLLSHSSFAFPSIPLNVHWQRTALSKDIMSKAVLGCLEWIERLPGPA
jgi:hypothetical protein